MLGSSVGGVPGPRKRGRSSEAGRNHDRISTGCAGRNRGGGGVQTQDSCTGASDWKLKAKADNGRLEVEFEVDSNKVGQMWNVRLFDNGTRFFAGTRTTMAPSGSFEVRQFTTNQAGPDRITARATKPPPARSAAAP